MKKPRPRTSSGDQAEWSPEGEGLDFVDGGGGGPPTQTDGRVVIDGSPILDYDHKSIRSAVKRCRSVFLVHLAIQDLGDATTKNHPL